jgi:hypothetical protein
LDLASEPFHLPRFWSAPIPRDVIICTDDRSHRLEIDRDSLERLGVTLSFGIASSHSPFISRPADTAKLLDRCAAGTLA